MLRRHVFPRETKEKKKKKKKMYFPHRDLNPSLAGESRVS
jgi:hypothetical protein